MNLHHPIVAAFPLPLWVAVTESLAPEYSWYQVLPQYGVCGCWILWFILRDRVDREERKGDRLDIERRHQENLAAQRAVENAFRTNTNSIITAMAATKHMDGAFTELLERIKEDNQNRAGK